VVWLCWLVVNQPQIGIGRARPCRYPVPESRVCGILLVWIAEAAVVDKDLKRLGQTC
jgi:hypothetical protein